MEQGLGDKEKRGLGTKRFKIWFTWSYSIFPIQSVPVLNKVLGVKHLQLIMELL